MSILITSLGTLRLTFGAVALSLASMAAVGQSPVAIKARPFEDSMAQRTLACTACHGEQGQAGPDGYYPRLAGKPAGYLYHQLLNFRDGRRHYGLMTRMVEPLNDAYLMDIARHFASLDLPYPAPASAAGLPSDLLQRGRTLALRGDEPQGLPACVQCHGTSLTGVAPHVPGLLGLPRDYLNAQLGGWRTGERKAHAPDCMATIAQRLTPADVASVAAWLSTQAVPNPAKATLSPPTVKDLAPVKRMDLSCGSAPELSGEARP